MAALQIRLGTVTPQGRVRLLVSSVLSKDSGIKLRLACVQMNGVSVNGCQSAPCLVGAGSKWSGMGDKSRVTKKKGRKAQGDEGA
jgi:hypothetical protein